LELFGVAPAFAQYEYDDSISVAGDLPLPDVIIASPIGCLAFVERQYGKGIPVIAAISDTYTSLLRHQASIEWREKRVLRFLWNLLRARNMRRLEGQMLEQASAVIVQTERDRSWVRTLRPPSIHAKTIVLSNGVSRNLIATTHERIRPRRILFITSEFTPHYARTIRSILATVWPSVKQHIADAEFHIIGRDIDRYPDLREIIDADPQIVYRSYVPDLVDVYATIRVAVVKIDKCYGYMNKVAEALAQGIPVVGDPAAFNGLEDALRVGAGFAAERDAEMTERVVNLLTDDEHWCLASDLAKNYAKTNLSWDKKRSTLISLIERIG
jgi:glycosyltransferase involved in cell wall biosynthesis